jgi:hypothetical protein
MRQLIGTIFVGAFFFVIQAAAHAQAPGAPGAGNFGGISRGVDPSFGYNLRYYAAPGAYGMSYGFPSYGSVRTYTEFSSPYGAGYAYGYPPYSYLTGRYGVGLWRPGFSAPGYSYGASSYRTFAVPYGSLPPGPLPPVGAYAPYLGPSAYYAW